MQYVASAASRRNPPPLTMRERIDRLNNWSRVPMTKRAEIGVPAAAGFLTFALFVLIYLSI